MRYPKSRRTPEEIADELAKDHLNPFDAHGKHFQGDIFYDSIHNWTKKMSYSAFQQVVDLLRARGYYIHS